MYTSLVTVSRPQTTNVSKSYDLLYVASLFYIAIVLLQSYMAEHSIFVT